jgi:hypothetical protein
MRHVYRRNAASPYCALRFLIALVRVQKGLQPAAPAAAD